MVDSRMVTGRVEVPCQGCLALEAKVKVMEEISMLAFQHIHLLPPDAQSRMAEAMSRLPRRE